MRIIEPSVEILTPIDGDSILQHIERCGRVCYKSEDKISEGTAQTFVKSIIQRGHESVLEHFNVTVKFIVLWRYSCENAETAYLVLVNDYGRSPQEARSVLPNSLKTELVMTANLREWRHFLKLRTSQAAHPQMREVALMLLEQFRAQIPVVFEDINP